jgi:FkbM family methyltransferase
MVKYGSSQRNIANMLTAIKTRFLIWKLVFNGTISAKIAFFNFLPSFLRPHVRETELFNKPFRTMDVTEFLGMVKQVILENECHAEFIKEKDVVLDAGANVGIFSIFVAVKYPRSTIYAFEPTPSTFEALNENAKYYPNITVFNCALGEENKQASIVPMGNSGGNYIGEGGIPVEIKTVDSFGLPVNFFKIDTEGYEANILKGATMTIKQYKPIIVMSAFHKPNDRAELPAVLNNIVPYRCELTQNKGGDFICEPS